MKTKEELKAIKEEVETVSKKLAELTEEELEQVTGGGHQFGSFPNTPCPNKDGGILSFEYFQEVNKAGISRAIFSICPVCNKISIGIEYSW